MLLGLPSLVLGLLASAELAGVQPASPKRVDGHDT